MTTSHRWTI
jgi:hypothetical protein